MWPSAVIHTGSSPWTSHSTEHFGRGSGVGLGCLKFMELWQAHFLSLLRQWAESGYWWCCICVRIHHPWCKNLKVRESILLPAPWLVPCVVPWGSSCSHRSTGHLQLLCPPSCPMQVSQRPQSISSSSKQLPMSNCLEPSTAKNNTISFSRNQ